MPNYLLTYIYKFLTADDLQDFVDTFDDGKVQYGFARVIDPNSNLPKFVLIGWVGEGIPERVKGYFNAHFSSISKYFRGYHVQITARSQDDLSVKQILQKVGSASGANYSAGLNKALPRKPNYAQSSTGASEDDWGDAPPVSDDGKVSKVQSSYRPTKVDISAIKSQAKEPASFSSNRFHSSAKPSSSEKPEVVKGSYNPIGKVDIATLRSQTRDDRFNPKPEPLQSSYKPIGKVDIAAIRAQANKKDEIEATTPKPKPTPKAAPPPKDYEDDEEEEEEDTSSKSVKDRLKSFGGSSAPAPKTSFGAASSAQDDDDEEEDFHPKSLKDRLNAYKSKAEPLSSSSKPKTKSAVSSRFAPSGRAGTAPPLPPNEFGISSAPKIVGGASRDFGSQGNKTPAQLWAEKHAKSHPESKSSVSSAPADEEEEEEEPHHVSDIRSRFAKASVDDEDDFKPHQPARSIPPPSLPSRSAPAHEEDEDEEEERTTPEAEEEEEEEEEDGVAVSDLKAKFAQRFAQSHDSESESEPSPALPSRNLPPPPPAANSAPSLPSRSVPPPPPAAPEPEEEEEEEEAAPPSLPSRNLPPPPGGDLPKRGLPPVFMAPGATPPLPSAPSSVKPPPAPEPEPEPEPEPAHEEEHAEAALDESELPLEAVVIYTYAKDEDNELSLEEGHKVTIVGFPDEKWWQAQDENGEDGLIPADYVQLLKPPVATAEFEYTEQEENEISFPEGALITSIQFVDEDWWLGTYLDKEGLFPSSYVTLKE